MRTPLRVYAALLTTVLFWGLSFIGTKAALTSFHPFALMFLRFSSASLVFLAVLLRTGFPRIPARDHLKLVLVSLFQPCLYFIFETFGLSLTSASKASLIIAAVPIAVMLLAAIVLKERIRARHAAGIVLSVAGVVVLVVGTPGFRLELGGSFLGDILIFGAVVTAALYTVLARDLGRTRSALEITAFQAFYGTLFFLPFFLATRGRTEWAAISGSSLAALVFLIFCATIGAFLTYNYALTKIPASRASVFINGIPLVTTLASWALLGETLSPVQLAGGALVLVSVYIVSSESRRDRPVRTLQEG